MKPLVRSGLQDDFESSSHHVRMQLLAKLRSADFKQAMTAFVERRKSAALRGTLRGALHG